MTSDYTKEPTLKFFKENGYENILMKHLLFHRLSGVYLGILDSSQKM